MAAKKKTSKKKTDTPDIDPIKEFRDILRDKFKKLEEKYSPK